MLTSNDMDLTEADYLQFHIIYGCIVHPTHRNQSVLVQYSTNGGVQWKLIEEMVYDQYLESRYGVFSLILEVSEFSENSWILYRIANFVNLLLC